MADLELTPDEEDFIADVKDALRNRRGRGAQPVNYRTAEQIDLAIEAALERRRRQWWDRFWKLVGRAAVIVGLVAGLTVIGANTGLCSRQTPPAVGTIDGAWDRGRSWGTQSRNDQPMNEERTALVPRSESSIKQPCRRAMQYPPPDVRHGRM